MKSCIIIMIFCFVLIGCENNISRPIYDNPQHTPNYPNTNPNYDPNYNPGDTTYDSGNWENEELLRKVREYPVILAVDHTKPVLMQKEMIFAAVNTTLSNTFTVIDGYQLDKDIRDEVMSTTGSGTATYQDILFRKFTAADVCVYLWCEINPYDGNIQGRPITFHEARMGCRVVDTFNKRILADIVKSSGRQHYNSGSEDDKQRRAVEMILPQLRAELEQTLNSRIGVIIKDSFRIRGVIEHERDLELFKTTIRDLEHEDYFKIKRVISESAHFEYEIAFPSRSVAGISEVLRDTARSEGLKINVRVSERANTRLIQVSLGDSGFDD